MPDEDKDLMQECFEWGMELVSSKGFWVVMGTLVAVVSLVALSVGADAYFPRG